MDWAALVPQLVKLGAPLLGQAIGGPFGAVAGKILADAIGAGEAHPAAVAEAIANADPSAAAAAVRAAEDKWLAALADLGRAQVTEIGATQRAEMASDDPLQRWWRPLYALELTLFECPGFALVLGHALWTGASEAINGFGALSGLLITYMGARFGVLGVYISGRSREKQAAATGQNIPSVVGEVFKAVVKRK
jgi:hypothetical protein